MPAGPDISGVHGTGGFWQQAFAGTNWFHFDLGLIQYPAEFNPNSCSDFGEPCGPPFSQFWGRVFGYSKSGPLTETIICSHPVCVYVHLIQIFFSSQITIPMNKEDGGAMRPSYIKPFPEEKGLTSENLH